MAAKTLLADLPSCVATNGPASAPTSPFCRQPYHWHTSSPANSAQYNPNLFLSHGGAAGNFLVSWICCPTLQRALPGMFRVFGELPWRRVIA